MFKVVVVCNTMPWNLASVCELKSLCVMVPCRMTKEQVKTAAGWHVGILGICLEHVTAGIQVHLVLIPPLDSLYPPSNVMTASDKRFLISAPGKVILFGEHAVVHKKVPVTLSTSFATY